MPYHTFHNVIKTAVVSDYTQHTAGQKSHNHQVAHAHHTLSHGAQPAEPVKRAGAETYYGIQQYAYKKHHSHIHTEHGKQYDR